MMADYMMLKSAHPLHTHKRTQNIYARRDWEAPVIHSVRLHIYTAICHSIDLCRFAPFRQERISVCCKSALSACSQFTFIV